jgi:uncharacterized repeat protein (TIGR01451 family)
MNNLPRRAFLGVLLATALPCGLISAAPANAATPYWHLTSGAAPANLPPGGKGKVIVTATNLGDAVASGEVTIIDKLPSGLTATAVTGSLAYQTGSLIECSVRSSSEVACVDHEPLQPLTGLKVTIAVAVGAEVVGKNHVEATGGKAEAATLEEPVKVSGTAAGYGVEKYSLSPEREGGAPDREAGSHPFQLTTSLSLNQTTKQEPVALTKNLQFTLPPGLIGNPNATPRCDEAEFSSYVGIQNLCKPNTVVGIAEVTIEEPNNFKTGPEARTVPVFNLVPSKGEPARFGFEVLKNPVVLTTSVRTGKDYGVTVTANSSSETAGLISSVATFWGVPGDARHNLERGWNCVEASESLACKKQQEVEELAQKKAKEKGEEPTPFLMLPTSCEGKPLEAPMRAQSWRPGEEYGPFVESEFEETLEGCNKLLLKPTIEVQPTTHAASTPTALDVTVKVPQEETDEGLAESAVKATTVVFPEGMQLNPAAAGGLLACSAMQVGFLGSEAEESLQTNNNRFSPDFRLNPENPEEEPSSPHLCPGPATIGSVEIISPDLENPLKGSVYLAAQDTSPFEPPLVIYLVARDPVSGVLVKLAGKTKPIEGTGQVESTFENTPQVPFKELKLHLFGGESRGAGRASVTTPPQCGSYETTSSFVPWSGREATSVSPEKPFEINSGPGGGACTFSPNAQPFAPSFTAGVTNLQGGAFTGFSLTIGRPDGHQALTGITTHLPQGLAALISSINPCPIAQADAVQCGTESLVGHSTGVTGLGSEPFSLPGRAYLTGPYDGAPFGLSDATPAVAGPFNLGTVISNSTIEIDPNTAAVTVTTRETRILDPRGQTTIANSALPTMIKGVPVQLKAINVQVDRPNFQFNPTNCNRMSITGALSGSQGGSESVSAPFQVANCANLPFAPKLTAHVDRKGSKANGVGFFVKLESPGLGQANIHEVELQLPIALPSRLSTIQQACRDSVFEANPAACDEGSVIGKAVIHTPVLKNPLEGPAYLVSHANLAFPDVVFVLQGEGIKLVLDGHTDIKKGITYSRFETAPDAPFSTFETSLPAGPHSALGVNVASQLNYSLCGANLAIPTKIVSQNGAIINETTQANPTGCVGVKQFKETRLQKALKECRKKKNKRKRIACERAARKKYGPHPKHKSHKKKK